MRRAGRRTRPQSSTALAWYQMDWALARDGRLAKAGQQLALPGVHGLDRAHGGNPGLPSAIRRISG